MSDLTVLKRLTLLGVVLTLLLLLFGTGVALAADGSNSYVSAAVRDNASEGFSTTYPHHCWQGFDMVYYGGYIWESYFRGGVGTPDEYDRIAVYLAKQPVGPTATPISEPEHYTVPDADKWSDEEPLDLVHRRHTAARLAVFKDRLFLFSARTYGHNTDMILWEKELDPTKLDGQVYEVDGQNLWAEYGDSDHPKLLQGLVVKVIKDTIYILGQQAGSHDLYLMKSSDSVTYSRTKIHTFAENDCILNGDIVPTADGGARIAFVTKDDLDGGDDSTGLCKLWVFNPDDDSVIPIATVDHRYKDMAVVAGNVKGCTPYDANNLQIWAVGWGTENVYHMQYTFNDDVNGGAFDPTGILDCGNTSTRMTQEYRGYLAACAAPEEVEGQTSGGKPIPCLQMTARVWWWGSTDVYKAHGRSIEYSCDYLQNLGTALTNTGGKTTIQDPWVLLGIVSGLPPYYANGTNPDHIGSNYMVTWGTSSTISFTTTIESEKTLTLSYEAQDIFGIPTSSMGFSYSDAVQQKEEETTQSTVSQSVSFSPAYSDGTKAWGVFMAPKIYNERYELRAPDKTTPLGCDLYYTYIGEISSLIAIEYPLSGGSTEPFWSGVKTYPSSLTYWDPQWTGSDTLLTEQTDTYTSITNDFLTQSSGSDFYLTNTDIELESKSATNTMTVETGAFGFKTGVKGSLRIDSSSTMTLGTNLLVHYAVPRWIEPPVLLPGEEYAKYLYWMSMRMYFLEPLNQDAFWIPDGVKKTGRQSMPWCLTWHVSDYDNVERAAARVVTGQLPRAGADGGEVQVSPQLRKVLLMKLEMLRADYDRGDVAAVLRDLKAIINQVNAQAGKGIDAATAERLAYVLKGVGFYLRQ